MLGIISALGAAGSWTYACFLWRQQSEYLSASQINIIKNILAFVVFSPVFIRFDFQSNFKETFILLLSGIIGIAIGDCFYILSLKALGTRRTLSVEASSPVVATVLGSFFLNEMLSLKVWIGVILVSISLIGVAAQKIRNTQATKSNISKKNGFIFAFLSVICAVTAAILSRFVLKNSDLNPLQSTEIRLLGSIIALVPFANNTLIKSIRKVSFNNKVKLLLATLLGTNIGILLQQNVFKLLPIGLGWTLLSISPAISLFFVKAEGEKLTPKTLALTATTLLGVVLVFID